MLKHMTAYFCDKTLEALCTCAFESLWTERLLHHYRNFLQRRMRLCRILRCFFVNCMGALRPPLFKGTATLSSDAFGNE